MHGGVVFGADNHFFGVRIVGGILFGFVVLRHARRKILFTSATYHPNGQWLRKQMINTFFDGNKAAIKYLIRDRDKSYGEEFSRTAFGLGIEEVMISPH